MPTALKIVATAAAVMMGAATAHAFTLWNDLRHSALLPDQTVTIRVENPPAAGAAHTILYLQGGVQEAPLVAVPDGPATLEGQVPGPVSGSRGYGFRQDLSGAIDLMTVPVEGGGTPTPADLTLLADDPVGDGGLGLPHLDLTGVRIGSDGTRLYAALSNAGGGFPVNSGLTFFSYLLGIKDPAVAEPGTLFAMIQTVTAASIIEPGLYQINGTGVSDLVKIGEITATEFPAENTLLLSCALADLEANPVFQSWYDPADPRMDVAGFSQRITLLGGTQEADRTLGCIWHLREVILAAGANGLPQLSDLVVPATGAGGFVSVTFNDPDSHCPVVAEVTFPGGEAYPLRPQSLDYGQPVVYRSEPDLPPLQQGGAAEATVRFSDNLADVVTLTQAVSSVPGTPFALRLEARPNPFNPATVIAYGIDAPGHAVLEVFGVDGRHVVTLAAGYHDRGPHEVTWDGTDARGRRLASGVWFVRLNHGSGVVTRKLVMTK